MVLKRSPAQCLSCRWFESDVISDGTQTSKRVLLTLVTFESDVISDGTQTSKIVDNVMNMFESNVISDGTQTRSERDAQGVGLRVM